MSYLIEVYIREIEEFAKVTIYNHSEHFRSARISQLQCIGWLYSIRQIVEERTSSQHLENPNYFQEALIRLGGVSNNAAVAMDKLKTEKDIFNFAWSLISLEEKEVALSMNYDHYDNFWSTSLLSNQKNPIPTNPHPLLPSQSTAKIIPFSSQAR